MSHALKLNLQSTRHAQLMQALREEGISFTVTNRRAGAMSIDAAVPGQRWEVDVLEDGSVEIEVFKSDGRIFGNAKLKELFRKFGEKPRMRLAREA